MWKLLYAAPNMGPVVSVLFSQRDGMRVLFCYQPADHRLNSREWASRFCSISVIIVCMCLFGLKRVYVTPHHKMRHKSHTKVLS